MRDKYTEAIRIGIVSSIYPERGTAKVTFPDRHDIVSRELPVVVPCTLKDKWYYMPDVGERVRVLFDPEAPSRGCILGSYYDDVREPPEHDEANIQYVLFKDETLIKYDRKHHKLTITIPKANPEEVSIEVTTAIDINVLCKRDINITTERDIIVESARDIKVTAACDIEIKALGEIKIHSVGALSIDSDTSIAINAPRVDINDKY